jgi:hypothetical protein
MLKDTNMQQKFLMVKARSLDTQMTVKSQELDGLRYTPGQRALAQYAADQLAVKMSQRTNESWVGFVEEYVPQVRK